MHTEEAVPTWSWVLVGGSGLPMSREWAQSDGASWEGSSSSRLQVRDRTERGQASSGPELGAHQRRWGLRLPSKEGRAEAFAGAPLHCMGACCMHRRLRLGRPVLGGTKHPLGKRGPAWAAAAFRKSWSPSQCRPAAAGHTRVRCYIRKCSGMDTGDSRGQGHWDTGGQGDTGDTGDEGTLGMRGH